MTPLTFFISVGLLAFVGLLLYGHWLQKKEEKSILTHGLQVEARILELSGVRSRPDHDPVATLHCELIAPPEGAPGLITLVDVAISPLHAPRFQPGCLIILRLKRTQLERAILDRPAMKI